MYIEYIVMYVNDLEKIKEFFIKYLGVKLNNIYYNKKIDFKFYFLIFDSGCCLEIMIKLELVDEKKDLKRIGFIYIVFSVGSKEKVDELIEILKVDGFEVISGLRIIGDGYYESCIVGIEGN